MALPRCVAPSMRRCNGIRRELRRLHFCCANSGDPRPRPWLSISAVTPKPRLSKSGLTIWRPTMNSPATMTTTPSNSLSSQLRQIGLYAIPADLDDFLARATKHRWSPQQLIEQLARAEIDERSRRSMERRLRYSGIRSFKPMADFDWNWPTKIERDVIERALTLDFLSESGNLVLGGRKG